MVSVNGSSMAGRPSDEAAFMTVGRDGLRRRVALVVISEGKGATGP